MNFRPAFDPAMNLTFGVGQSVPRNEDPILVTGRGRYTDDVMVEGQVYAAFVRSSHAHGRIRAIDTGGAQGMKGVLGIYTAADLEGQGYGTFGSAVPMKNRDGTPMAKTDRLAFAKDKVRFVGDPVAMVVARTQAQAREAAEAIVVDVDVLPAITTTDQALDPKAPQLFDDVPGNTVLDWHFGDTAKVAEAFRTAAHVTRLRLLNSRIVVNPMEPRSAIAEYKAKEKRFVMHVQSQGVFGMRRDIAASMGVSADRVRIETGNVGGGFGMKAVVFPEYQALLHASRVLRKPIKWTDTRSESFVSDHHGRDMVFDGELALDARGRFLAVRFTGAANLGGYVTPYALLMPTLNVPRNSASIYRTPLIEVSARCVVTNTVPVGAYRGAGRPESNFFMERLIDVAAAEMKIDKAALRRRNLVRADQIPWKSAAGTTYDSGDFPALLDRALEQSDWGGYRKRLAASRKAGLLRGRGLGCFLEVTGFPANELGGIHFEADGSVSLLTGTMDNGQGHWTAFAQVLTTKLGVPFDKIRLVQGDSDKLVAGNGTGGSKSIMSSGKAIIEAGDLVIEKGRRLAAHFLETDAADIEFDAGSFRIAGTDRSLGIMDLADRLRTAPRLPDGLPTSLDVDHVIKPSEAAYPNGCHVCELEIDPETGVIRIDRYTAVSDFGVLINPLLVQGQTHGGVVQGIGQIIHEMTSFDSEGQLVTGAFTDYAMPRADDVPFIDFVSSPTPATTNPLGAKGCGEAGCAGSMPAVMNAIVDALAPFGITNVDMPATPLKIWSLIHGHRH